MNTTVNEAPKGATASYAPEKALLGTIQETKFNRSLSFNYRGIEKDLLSGGASLYSKEELEKIKEANVGDRLPPRITDYYRDIALKSPAITNLIKARPEETQDLSGERDPSNQLRYSPVPGLLHKYELVLLYVVRACSAWCRYCYRSDFLTNKTEKDIGSIDAICSYIVDYNQRAAANNAILASDKKPMIPIKEALLSGGDPMVLNNKNLFEYMYGLAKAGVRTIRIGTKELAFFPARFDDNFFAMLDTFHEIYPDVNIAFMVHFTHPDELLAKDEHGSYITKENGQFKRMEIVEKAIRRIKSLNYTTMENQTPIIDGVNDNADALRLLQIELKRLGVNNHYYFQCREIEGHKIFAVPVEKAWKIHQESQIGLSGIEKSRFSMSTEYGKLEVVSIIDKLDLKQYGVNVPPAAQTLLENIFGEGLVVMKVHRTPEQGRHGDLVIAKRNPNALWISGYEDRILYDARKGEGHQFAPLVQLLADLFGEENLRSAIHAVAEESIVEAA